MHPTEFTPSCRDCGDPENPVRVLDCCGEALCAACEAVHDQVFGGHPAAAD